MLSAACVHADEQVLVQQAEVAQPSVGHSTSAALTKPSEAHPQQDRLVKPHQQPKQEEQTITQQHQSHPHDLTGTAPHQLQPRSAAPLADGKRDQQEYADTLPQKQMPANIRVPVAAQLVIAAVTAQPVGIAQPKRHPLHAQAVNASAGRSTIPHIIHQNYMAGAAALQAAALKQKTHFRKEWWLSCKVSRDLAQLFGQNTGLHCTATPCCCCDGHAIDAICALTVGTAVSRRCSLHLPTWWQSTE